MKYRYIIISLFLVISIGLSNQSNEQTIEENEIECFYGTKEEFYLINNSKNHKFLIFIKSKNIVLYNLYKGDKQNKIPSYNVLSNDIYYYIKDESFLYLNILAYTYECFSFQFSETPYLDLKEKQNFTHPIIDFGTIIKFPIANTYQKKLLYIYIIFIQQLK